MPFHNYLIAMAGKTAYAHGPGLLRLLAKPYTQPAQELKHEIEESIRHKRFDAVVSDEYPYLFQNVRNVRENEEWFALINKDLLNQYYEPSRKLFPEDLMAFFPTTAWLVRPSVIYVPKKSDF